MSESELDQTIEEQFDIVRLMQKRVRDRGADPATCREYVICLSQAVDKLATLGTMKQAGQLEA